jgi:hypothetical protein
MWPGAGIPALLAQEGVVRPLPPSGHPVKRLLHKKHRPYVLRRPPAQSAAVQSAWLQDLW